jgi:hypothetical protein
MTVAGAGDMVQAPSRASAEAAKIARGFMIVPGGIRVSPVNAGSA